MSTGYITDTPKEDRRDLKKRAFLITLAETCSVQKAVDAIGITRMTAYNWREADPEFAAEWEKAKAIGATVLVDEAVRRGHEGVDEPVFYEGKRVDTVRKYSDNLMGRLLQAYHPEFRTTDITSGGKPINADPATIAIELTKLAEVLKNRRAEDEV